MKSVGGKDGFRPCLLRETAHGTQWSCPVELFLYHPLMLEGSCGVGVCRLLRCWCEPQSEHLGLLRVNWPYVAFRSKADRQPAQKGVAMSSSVGNVLVAGNCLQTEQSTAKLGDVFALWKGRSNTIRRSNCFVSVLLGRSAVGWYLLFAFVRSESAAVA